MGAQRMANKRNQAILENLPKDVRRIKVLDANMNEKWRTPGEILDTDTIVLKDDGNPYTMAGKPGRKPKPTRLPSSDNAAELVEAKKVSMSEDPILKTLKNNSDSETVINHIMNAIGTEAASLEFEREENARKGKDTSSISVRRLNALKSLGDMWFKKKERLAARGLDIESPAFATALKFIAETVKKNMLASGMRAESVESVFSRMAKDLSSNEWKAELEVRLEKGE
jgi:hypothetical protein